jgi:hypothetical protein
VVDDDPDGDVDRVEIRGREFLEKSANLTWKACSEAGDIGLSATEKPSSYWI